MDTQPDAVVLDHVSTYLENFQDVFCTSICSALQETKFANRMRIAPRRLDELGKSEVAAFQHYVKQRDSKEVVARGKQLAFEGLGHTSIIKVAAAMRKSWLKVPTEPTNTFADFLTITEEYVGSLLEGYIDGCEEEVRHEQQLTQAAYQRTLEHSVEHVDSNSR